MSGLKNNKNGFLNYIFSKNRVALVYFVGMILSWITFFVYAGIQGDGYYRILSQMIDDYRFSVVAKNKQKSEVNRPHFFTLT